MSDMNLTPDEIIIIKSRIPFMGMKPGKKRFDCIANFMYRAETLHIKGLERLLCRVVALDLEGHAVELEYDSGEKAGTPPGWLVKGVLK